MFRFSHPAKIRGDDLGAETGRFADAHSYTLCDLNTEDKLPIPFRYYDPVSAENT
jgi:hypothetical protein